MKLKHSSNSSKSRRVTKTFFPWTKVAFGLLLALLIGIYFKFKLYEKFFADSPATSSPATSAPTEPKTQPTTSEVNDDKAPIQGVTDVKLFDKDTINEETKKYIQKEVASMIPMTMEKY
jgi:hypothetical protein